MTITYSNGTTLDAIVLSHEEHAIHAAVAGHDDVLSLTCIHGAWVSEELEPVNIQFAWQRVGTSPAPTEEDCICPKDLAARLIQLLFEGGGQETDMYSPVGRSNASCAISVGA